MKFISITNVQPVDWGGVPISRPPDTVNLTGHIDDGSDVGACGNGAGSFRTKYIPWITCAQCWVIVDWGLESGLLESTETGVEQIRSQSEKDDIEVERLKTLEDNLWWDAFWHDDDYWALTCIEI